MVNQAVLSTIDNLGGKNFGKPHLCMKQLGRKYTNIYSFPLKPHINVYYHLLVTVRSKVFKTSASFLEVLGEISRDQLYHCIHRISLFITLILAWLSLSVTISIIPQ